MLDFDKIKKYFFIAICLLLCVCITVTGYEACSKINMCMTENKKDDFIKYVEFKVPYEALEKALKVDIDTHTREDKGLAVNWIELLACLAAKRGGDFSCYKNSELDKLVKDFNSGESFKAQAKNDKLYKYYLSTYTVILKEFVGPYKEKCIDERSDSELEKECYGLKVFSPIAKTFPFNHYDDFGSHRSYGFIRPHLGHDLMAAVGTPVVAIEGGTVEVMGWNQYGGWRIGIRSFDKNRYYYYAHLRKDKPFHVDLKENQVVQAGDVIGYVGRTGYSIHENVNNIKQSHLHLGMELIFDESQKESNNEIWIDLYAITKLLQKNQSEVFKNLENKNYYRKLT